MTDETPMRSEDFVSNLGAAVRDNPLPAALIGMGLVWLLTGGRSIAKAGFGHGIDATSGLRSRGAETARDIAGTIRDSANSAGASMSEAGDAMARGMSNVGSALSASASDVIRSGRPDFDFASARSNIANLMQRQPLLLGAIGLAIGAGVAASLRPTAAEVDLLGDASARFQEKTRDLAAATTRRASELVDNVAATVANEARVQGLTPDKLKQNVMDIGRKVQSVVGTSAETARSSMN
jgi:hypothetical protein